MPTTKEETSIMARYTGPGLRKQRRIGEDLFLKGILKGNPQNNAKEARDLPPLAGLRQSGPTAMRR